MHQAGIEAKSAARDQSVEGVPLLRRSPQPANVARLVPQPQMRPRRPERSGRTQAGRRDGHRRGLEACLCKVDATEPPRSESGDDANVADRPVRPGLTQYRHGGPERIRIVVAGEQRPCRAHCPGSPAGFLVWWTGLRRRRRNRIGIRQSLQPRRHGRCGSLGKAAHQQGIDSRRIGQVGIVLQPACQFVRRRAAVPPEIAVGQDMAGEQRICDLRGVACRGLDVPVCLQGEDPTDACGVARVQRAGQRNARVCAGKRHARDRHGGLVTVRRRAAGASRFRVCSCPREYRGPGNQRPGNGEAGERSTDPSHDQTALHAPPVRHNPC